jgi:hypothetical protein
MAELGHHRAEVIALYPNTGEAAVKFRYQGHDRIECVKNNVSKDGRILEIGMRGWVKYYSTNRIGYWSFTLSK